MSNNSFALYKKGQTFLAFGLFLSACILTNDILTKVVTSYGANFINVVLEITINDIAGVVPTVLENPNRTPLTWFHDVKNKDFIPKWKREKVE